MLGDVSTIKAALDQMLCPIDQHPGKQVSQRRRIEGFNSYNLLFIQLLPCVAEQVIDVLDRNSHATVMRAMPSGALSPFARYQTSIPESVARSRPRSRACTRRRRQ